MMRHPAWRPAAALVLLLLAGCSNKGAVDASKSRDPGNPSSSTSASAPGSTGTPAPGQTGGTSPTGTARPNGTGTPKATGTPGGGATSPGSNATSSPKPSGGTTQTQASLPPSKLVAKLTKDCVPAGSEQTLTVTTGPNAFVAFVSKYSDGKGGGDYGGQEQSGHADSSGVYTKTYLVAPTAPAGKVEVTVAAHQQGYNANATQLTFQVATGAC